MERNARENRDFFRVFCWNPVPLCWSGSVESEQFSYSRRSVCAEHLVHYINGVTRHMSLLKGG